MGIPAGRIVSIFLALALLLHFHTYLPEWEELRVVSPDANWKDKAHIESNVWDQEEIWDHIHPHRTLIWHHCYRGPPVRFECARLLVPLDYSSPISSTNQASIAIIRIPSPYRHRTKEYKGPILFNPGGPGGSGVDFIQFGGSSFRAVLGDGFDLVGFDPRGVSRSRPFVSFFPSPLERSNYYSRQSAFRIVNSSTNSIAELVAGSQLVNLLAEQSDMNGSLKFFNTDHTARDMLSIITAYREDKLQYWGFSYGTILGATFATLFPDRVGRLVIDGVADADDYYSTSWSTNLLDTDKVLESFFDSCYQAGPSGCPFYASSPSAISQNLTKIYERLYSNPLPFIGSPSGPYAVVDYSLLRENILGALYGPYATFPQLAQVLARLSRGDPPLLRDMTNLPRFSNDGLDPENRVGEAQIAIACNDGKRIPGTVQDTEAHFEKLGKISRWADSWTRIRTMCTGWPDYPKYSPDTIAANTSHPMLLIGNTADPVTPLWAAKKMSKSFPGSVVLTQDSPGHCSISGPSTCTMKHVRAYFEDGTLPEEGTVCPVLGRPIPAPDSKLAALRAAPTGGAEVDGQVPFGEFSEMATEDMVLVAAVRKLSESYSLPRL